MTRQEKLRVNTIVSLVNQIVTLICGFVLPRLFLSYYGSAVNGLVSSITQFLGFISLCECGVGAVVRSTLYTPLAKKDDVTISKIVKSSERFFKRIAYILAVYTIGLMVVYPFITIENFNYMYTTVLIFVMAISSFAQYYFGMTYRLLLSADQLGFIQLGIHCLAVLGNTVACSVLMINGASVQFVKLITSLIFLIQPIVLNIYVKKNYRIDKSIELKEEPIKQKWNGLAQHIASVILGNTDMVVLTLFSTLENVSIYSVYHLIVNGVKQIVDSLTNGMMGTFGNMLANEEYEVLGKTFSRFEWLMHMIITFAFSATGILIVPFVSVYTQNVMDVNYIVPVFAILLTLAQASYCLRLPYNIVILAAGHYRQTQWSAIIEALINIVISIFTVFEYGLIGVAIGTLIAMLYRTCYFVLYLSRNIIYREIRHFVKHIIVDIMCVCLIAMVSNFIAYSVDSYVQWIWLAIEVAVTSGAIIFVVNFFVYRDNVMYLLKKGLRK